MKQELALDEFIRKEKINKIKTMIYIEIILPSIICIGLIFITNEVPSLFLILALIVVIVVITILLLKIKKVKMIKITDTIRKEYILKFDEYIKRQVKKEQTEKASKEQKELEAYKKQRLLNWYKKGDKK